jgi:hypothetical protein
MRVWERPAAILETVAPQKLNSKVTNILVQCRFYTDVFQISSLLAERAQVKQYKTLLETLEHEKKQLETKVGEMQKTVVQSQVNANSDGKSDFIRYRENNIIIFKYQCAVV